MHLAPDRTDILAVLLPYRHDYLSQHIHGYQRVGCRCKSPGPAMGAGRGGGDLTMPGRAVRSSVEERLRAFPRIFEGHATASPEPRRQERKVL